MQKSNKNGKFVPSSPFRRASDRALHPQPVEAALRVTRKQRFIASAALTSGQVTVASLTGLYNMATSATTGQPLFSSARILQVEAWAPPGTTTPVTVALEWNGGTFAPHKRVSDTSIGATFPAHIRCAPPDNWIFRDWVDETGTSTVLFTIACPTGTVVDITAEFMLRNGESPPGADTIAGATAGEVYVRAPDSSGFLVPNEYLTY